MRLLRGSKSFHGEISRFLHVPCFVVVLIIIFRFEERKESKEKRLVSNEWTKTRERRERREALLVEGMRFDRTKVTSVTSRALDRPRGDPSFRKLRRIIRLSRQAVVLHQNSSAPLIHFPIHAFVPSPDTLCVLAFFLNFFPSAVLFSLRRWFFSHKIWTGLYLFESFSN